MNEDNLPSHVNRREFIARTAAGTAGLALGAGLAGCAAPARRSAKIPVGLQLYSVREACKTDFPGTLAAVGQMGYRGVEFAGYWNYSAPEIRKMLDDHGLVACGTHTPYDTILPDQLEATIEFNQVLGNRFLIVPNMSGRTRQEWLAHVRQFNELAARLKPLGMHIGYHAHANDFKPVEGEPAWDVFFGNTDRDVVMQLDTSNCCDGGADPVAVLHRYPGRCLSIHLKPNGGGPEAIIGEDKINWPAVFAWCETKGGTQWYVVEHESSRAPLDTVRRTLDALRAMGKA
jgi:sugar phosphate isomerase/epimerase